MSSIPLAASEPLAEVETFTRAQAAHDPYAKSRFVAFVVLHVLCFGSEICAMVNFAITRDIWFFSFILLPFLFSGLFCAHAAWHCDAPYTGSWYLPLKKHPLPLAMLLLVPLGFGQGVILQLAFEDYLMRSSRPEQLTEPAAERSPATLARPASNRFHLKALNGLFEGLPSATVIFYAFWGMSYPCGNPITAVKWRHERSLLALLGFISFLSSGLGLLELDICSSKAISKRMQRNMLYGFMHWVFRFSEVSSRVSLFISFMVMTRVHVTWWWVPLAIDFALTFLVVLHLGGAEKSWSVRPLCSIPCVFANIFLFVDSPVKKRAAFKVTLCLTVKHAIETVLLPTLAYLTIDNVVQELLDNMSMYFLLNWMTVVSIPLYWGLLWWVTSTSMQRHKHCTADIFWACKSGSVSALRAAIHELTQSAAVGLDVNIYDIDGNTPLVLAAKGGHAEICHRLLHEGARVDVRIFADSRAARYCCLRSVRRRWTALHIAAYSGHTEVVQTLLRSVHGNAGEGGAGAEPPGAPSQGFQDEALDTPLHVAVQAGRTDVVALLTTACPDWVEEMNAKQLRPADLASSEEVKQAIAQAIAEASDSVSLARRPSQLPRGEDDWPQVELSIIRSSPDCSLMAPGLSSYIASSCGGALGRIFLAEVSHFRMMAGNFSEIPESVESSIVSERTPHRNPPVSGAVEESLTSQAAAELSMTELEPIDAQGQPVRWWLDLIHLQRDSTITTPMMIARGLMTQPPAEAVLGEGSYGLVWRAQERSSKQWYAVKNIRTRQGNTVALRECEVADRIRLRPHPCIVRLFLVHCFTDAGLYALVMEFCPNGDVLERIREARKAAAKDSVYQAPPQALRWIGQVFLGLEHMHRRMKTLLRDLKPENVVLTKDNCAKLTDFGFGRFGVEATGCWSFGIPTGSPGYVAPEILRKEEYDERADLYSLGVLTWILFTGGVTNSRDPMPPMGRMKHGSDFQAHFQDCFLLARCIATPQRHHARALDSTAKDFVVRLTDRHSDTRMKHQQIREHKFLRPLCLPLFDAPPSEVDTWCKA